MSDRPGPPRDATDVSLPPLHLLPMLARPGTGASLLPPPPHLPPGYFPVPGSGNGVLKGMEAVLAAHPAPMTVPARPPIVLVAPAAVPSPAPTGKKRGRKKKKAGGDGASKKTDQETIERLRASLSAFKKEAAERRRADGKKIRRLQRQVATLSGPADGGGGVSPAAAASPSLPATAETAAREKGGSAAIVASTPKAPAAAASVAAETESSSKKKRGPYRSRRQVLRPGESPTVTSWNCRFDQLEYFARGYGHCRVPKDYRHHAGLSRWVAEMRRAYRLLGEVTRNMMLAGKDPPELTGGFRAGRNVTGGNVSERAAVEKGAGKSAGDKADDGATGSMSAGQDDSAAASAGEGPSLVSPRPPAGLSAAAATIIIPAPPLQAPLHLTVTKLNAERIAKLNSIGFEWSVVKTEPKSWDERYKDLLEFKARNAHLRVSRDPKSPDSGLGEWLHTQRSYYKKNPSYFDVDDRIGRLESIGFEWNAEWRSYKKWDERYDQLAEFRRVHGNCNVPAVPQLDNLFPGGGGEGAEAVAVASPAEATAGQDGAEASARADAHPMDMLTARKRPKEVNDKIAFSSWVQRQRDEYRLWKVGRKCKLDKVRVKKLEDIGFDWGEDKAVFRINHGALLIPWDTRIDQLDHYKSKNGHLNIPSVYRGLDGLAQWASNMRAFYRMRKRGEKLPHPVSSEQFEQLTNMGFDWNIDKAAGIRRTAWEERYNQLLAFKAIKGHTRVPQLWRDNPQLANWVNDQRRQYMYRNRGIKKHALTDDRIEKLESVGFEWKVLNSGRRKDRDADAGGREVPMAEAVTTAVPMSVEGMQGEYQPYPEEYAPNDQVHYPDGHTWNDSNAAAYVVTDASNYGDPNQQRYMDHALDQGQFSI